MSRRASLAVVAASAAVASGMGCSPVFDVDIGWTIDGEDPAAACAFLPEGSVVRVTADSRDNHDDRFAGETRTTSADLKCGDGSGTIQTGNFADVLVELVAKNADGGDDVYGTGVPFSVNPGANEDGYVADAPAATTDIRLVQGTLHASLTVVGRGCSDAGATSFNVDLFENAEPRAIVEVKKGLTVNCENDKAEFVFSPVHVDSRYIVIASTEIGGETFSSGDGEGIDITSANTFSTVDLDKE